MEDARLVEIRKLHRSIIVSGEGRFEVHRFTACVDVDRQLWTGLFDSIVASVRAATTGPPGPEPRSEFILRDVQLFVWRHIAKSPVLL